MVVEWYSETLTGFNAVRRLNSALIGGHAQPVTTVAKQCWHSWGPTSRTMLAAPALSRLISLLGQVCVPSVIARGRSTACRPCLCCTPRLATIAQPRRGRGHRVSLARFSSQPRLPHGGYTQESCWKLLGSAARPPTWFSLRDARKAPPSLWTHLPRRVENRGALGAICTVKGVGEWVGSVLMWCCCGRPFCHLGKPCPHRGQDERAPGAASSIFQPRQLGR
jgi:hypothetical protein